MDFRWIPGKGVDLAAVERMKQHFPKPSEAPPEAWFMDPTNQGYYPELVEVPTEKLDANDLQHYLFDTGGGIKNFGRFQEWVVWFQYLLPYLLQRASEEDLLGHTVTYFLNMYPDGIVEEYPGFREDVLLTLPQGIMMNYLWNEQDLAIDHWWLDDWAGYWTGTFYATLFFCLKYLTSEEIPEWIASISKIPGQHWQERIVEWLNGMCRFFFYLRHPESVPEEAARKAKLEEGTIDKYLEVAGVNWWYSFLVFDGYHSSKNIDDYLPKENIEAFWREVKKYPQLSFTEINTENGLL